MFNYSNNIKFKNKSKKENLDELSKRGITVYDNNGNAVNAPVSTGAGSASNTTASGGIQFKTDINKGLNALSQKGISVYDKTGNAITPSSVVSTVSAPEVTAKNMAL